MSTLAKIIFSSLRQLPFFIRLHLSRFIVISLLVFLPRYRREIARNYRKLTGRTRSGFWIRNGAALGKNLALMLEIGKSGDNKILDRVIIQGENELMDAYRQGRGVVVVSFHFGPWELLPQLFARKGYPVAIATRPQRDRWLDRQLSRIRTSRPVRIVERVEEMKSALARGSLLGFLLDNTTITRRSPQDWPWPDFKVLRTPFALARATRSPVLPIVIYSQGSTPVVRIGNDLRGGTETPLFRNNRLFRETVSRHPQEWVLFGKA